MTCWLSQSWNTGIYGSAGIWLQESGSRVSFHSSCLDLAKTYISREVKVLLNTKELASYRNTARLPLTLGIQQASVCSPSQTSCPPLLCPAPALPQRQITPATSPEPSPLPCYISLDLPSVSQTCLYTECRNMSPTMSLNLLSLLIQSEAWLPPGLVFLRKSHLPLYPGFSPSSWRNHFLFDIAVCLHCLTPSNCWLPLTTNHVSHSLGFTSLQSLFFTTVSLPNPPNGYSIRETMPHFLVCGSLPSSPPIGQVSLVSVLSHTQNFSTCWYEY